MPYIGCAQDSHSTMSHKSLTHADEGVCTSGASERDERDSDGDGGDDERKAELKGGFIKGQWTKVNPLPLNLI